MENGERSTIAAKRSLQFTAFIQTTICSIDLIKSVHYSNLQVQEHITKPIARPDTLESGKKP